MTPLHHACMPPLQHASLTPPSYMAPLEHASLPPPLAADELVIALECPTLSPWPNGEEGGGGTCFFSYMGLEWGCIVWHLQVRHLQLPRMFTY
jgi:hypothetical protein